MTSSKQSTTFLKARVEGLTLIEVLIAAFIVSIIGTISFISLDQSVRSKEVIDSNIAKLARIDRAWIMLENDLNNALAHVTRQTLGPGTSQELPPFVLEEGGDYWMTVLRGGHANPLGFPRTELIRVGYRVLDETLYRDVWYDLGSVDVDQAKQQKVLDGVEEIQVRALPSTANSFTSGPWSDRWPVPGQLQREGTGSLLPLGVEVTLRMLPPSEQADEGEEIVRLFSLVQGD